MPNSDFQNNTIPREQLGRRAPSAAPRRQPREVPTLRLGCSANMVTDRWGLFATNGVEYRVEPPTGKRWQAGDAVGSTADVTTLSETTSQLLAADNLSEKFR
jgi:hypothetical protein